MESRRVNHSCYAGVFNQNYGGLGWGMDGVVVGMHWVQSQEVIVGCQEIRKHLLCTR